MRAPTSARELVELLGGQLDALVELREQAHERLRAQTEPHRIEQRLARVPGLGPIRAAQIAAVEAATARVGLVEDGARSLRGYATGEQRHRHVREGRTRNRRHRSC